MNRKPYLPGDTLGNWATVVKLVNNNKTLEEEVAFLERCLGGQTEVPKWEPYGFFLNPDGTWKEGLSFNL